MPLSIIKNPVLVGGRRVEDVVASGFAARAAELGAAWVLDPDQATIVGTTLTPALDAGGGATVLASADSAHAFNVDTTGPYGGVAKSLRTNTALGRLYSASGGPTGAGLFHIAWMGRVFGVGTNGDYESFLQCGAPNAAHAFGLAVDGGGNLLALENSGAVIQNLALDSDGGAQLAVKNDVDHLIEVQYDGSAMSFWINGKHNATIDIGTLTLNISDASIGVQSWQPVSGRYPIHDSRVDALMFKTGAIASRAAINKWLRYELARLGGTGKVVAFFGDSWTGGGAAGTTAANYFPVAVRGKSTGANVIYPQNWGHSGDKAADMLLKVAAHVDPLSHAHVWVGINDILNGLSAATIYASIVAAVKHLQARGARVVVGTIFQPKGLTGGQQAILQALNTFIRSNAAGANAIADYDVAMGPYNSANFADHPTDLHASDATNNNILAPVGYAALNAS